MGPLSMARHSSWWSMEVREVAGAGKQRGQELEEGQELKVGKKRMKGQKKRFAGDGHKIQCITQLKLHLPTIVIKSNG